MKLESKHVYGIAIVVGLAVVAITVAMAQPPATQMLTETEAINLQAAQEMLDALNSQDYGRVASLLHKDYMSSGPMELSSDFSQQREGAVLGKEINVDYLQNCDEALDGLSYGVDQTIASDQYVIQRWWARGKHVGEFLGIPPTNREVELHGISITEFKDGKQIRSWVSYDTAQLLQQMGVSLVPKPVKTSSLQ